MTRQELLSLGFDLTHAQHRQLHELVDALLDENTRVNLTAARDREPPLFWARHVCDCLGLWRLLADPPPRWLVDLGSGGGLPGLVLARLFPDTRFKLIDATRKKLDALQRVCDALGIENVRCVWGRAEELAHDPRHRERAVVMTARAVAPLPTLCELASGFVRVQGRALFMKSLTVLEDERRAAARAAGLCSLRFARAHRYALPDPEGERVILEYVKRKPLLKRYPRGVGVPDADPL